MKFINFAKKVKEKNIDNMTDNICETYRRMGIVLTTQEKSRIREKISSGICKGVLTADGRISSVSKKKK